MHKKFGSNDRRQVANLCYCYFRTAKLFCNLDTDEQLLSGLFLCGNTPDKILAELRPAWNENIHLTWKDKCSLLDPLLSIQNLFPLKEGLSDGIDAENYCASFLVQPDLFLRIRPGMKEQVLKKLEDAGCHYSIVSKNSIALPNSTKIENILELNKEVVVQDRTSQRVEEFLQLVRRGSSDRVKVWDCCAASGGKSILAKDVLGNIDLTVSDVRESILINLKKRFSAAGITGYKSFTADLAASGFEKKQADFQLIIADVPCSGSGTWARTPEQLFYFDKDRLPFFSGTQQHIVANVIHSLAPGGYLLYITCSVFREENEKIVEYIKENFHLELVKMEVLKGYDVKADTMFAALLRRSS